MFATARKAAKDLISSLSINAEDNLNLPLQCLPEKYSLLHLYERLALDEEKRNKEDKLANLLILTSCLSSSSRLAGSSSESQSITNLSLWISKAILPDGTFVLNKDGAQTLSSKQRIHAGFLAKQSGTLGLRSLNLLTSLSSTPSTIDNSILLSALAFTNDEDPWTTSFARDQARTFLTHYESQIHSSAFIVAYLLQSNIRPLFLKSHPSTITSSGRKAMPSTAPPKHHDFTAEQANKPWKYEAPYSLAVLEFCVKAASDEIMKDHWSLYIPPLLTLLDDTSAYIRVRGLPTTSLFLPKLPSQILIQSGLDSVFEEAITPSLSWLPNLTPLGESLEILPAAYTALSSLCDARYPLPPAPPAAQSPIPISISNKKKSDTEQEKLDKLKKDRLKFLDRVMRQGIFSSYAHSSTNPDIVEILIEQMSVLVAKIGIHSVKHLKDIIPILSAVMSDPFAAAHERLLLETVKALQVTILNTWPRMSEEGHRNEIIKALVVAWKTMNETIQEQKRGGDERKEDVGCDEIHENALESGRKEIKIAGRLLVKAIEGEVDVRAELEPLLKVDGKLVEEVFGITTSE